MTTEEHRRGTGAWLANLSEVERIDGWAMRSALVRYAQAQPVRAGAVLEVVRRIDASLAPHRSRLERQSQASVAEPDPDVAAVLEVAALLDQLADTLATWAADPRTVIRPDDAVDRVVADVTRRLDLLGVARESRDPAEWANARRSGR